MIGVGIPGGGYRLSKGLAGMVKNKENSESSTMKPLLLAIVSENLQARGSSRCGLHGQQGQHQSPCFPGHGQTQLASLYPAFWSCVFLLQFAGFLHSELRKIACSRQFIDLQSCGVEASTQACGSKVCALELYRLSPRNAQNFLGELLAMVLVICWQIFNNQLSGRKRN